MYNIIYKFLPGHGGDLLLWPDPVGLRHVPGDSICNNNPQL